MIFIFGLAAFWACLTGVKSVDEQPSIGIPNHGQAQNGRLWFFRFGKVTMKAAGKALPALIF
jgi:hypothetical protein